MTPNKNYQSKNPFSANLRTFMYANDITRTKFADMLTNRTYTGEQDGKIYSSNDIWTYDSRGSLPKNGKALVAIAQIIQKPLEELLTNEFTQEQLKIAESLELTEAKKSIKPHEDNLSSLPEGNRFSFPIDYNVWNIERLKELTKEEQTILFALLDSFEEADGRYCSFCDTSLEFQAGKNKVTATVFFGDEIQTEKSVSWDWNEYREYAQEASDEEVIALRLENKLFEKFYNVGLIHDIYCSAYEDTLAEKNRYVICIRWNLTLKERIELIETHLNKLQARLEQIREENA